MKIKLVLMLAIVLAVLKPLSSLACSVDNPCGFQNSKATWSCPAGYSCGQLHCSVTGTVVIGVYGGCDKSGNTELVKATVGPNFS